MQKSVIIGAPIKLDMVKGFIGRNIRILTVSEGEHI